MTDNLCSSGGILGPTHEPVPTDPATFQYWGQHKLVLCSHVVCSACGNPVRWADGYMVDGGPAILPEAYMGGELSSAAGVSRGLACQRLYLCTCRYYQCGGPVGLYQAGERPDLQLPTSWACGGHPPRELPATVGDRPVPATPEWRSIILKAFRSPVSADAPRRELEWVQEAYGVLGGTPHRVAIGAVIGDLLVSDEPPVRAHAIHFLWSELDAPQTDLVPPMLVEDEATLRSQPDVLWGADLYDTAVGTVAFHIGRNRWPYEGATRELIRAHLLQPARVDGAASLAAERDSDWFLEHAEALVRLNPRSVAKVGRWRAIAEANSRR